MWRRPSAWMVTVFMGLQSTCFYTMVTWLPTILIAGGATPETAGVHMFVFQLVGIPAAARKRAGGYSMGMRQRLGLAVALLGDPQVLVLDEPANGLDPEGIRWLRGFMRHLAGQGKTILVSSHMLQEVEQTVDDVVIISNGRLVRSGTMCTTSGSSRQSHGSISTSIISF